VKTPLGLLPTQPGQDDPQVNDVANGDCQQQRAAHKHAQPRPRNQKQVSADPIPNPALVQIEYAHFDLPNSGAAGA
jgi:hypothetical protein